MNKNYRDMTPEESLQLIRAASKKNGFMEVKELVEEYEKTLQENSPLSPIATENHEETLGQDALDVPEKLSGDLKHFEEITTPSGAPPVENASIYAPEHIPAVNLDNEGRIFQSSGEQAQVVDSPKARVLEQGRRPNPWVDVETVSPGQLKL